MAKKTDKKNNNKILYIIAIILIAYFAPQWLGYLNISKNSTEGKIANFVQSAKENFSYKSSTITNNVVDKTAIGNTGISHDVTIPEPINIDDTGWRVEDAIGEIEPVKYLIKRVVDGDTFVIDYNGKEKKVRLIGVDTPETVKANTPVQPFGPEASEFTKKSLEGKEVQIEFDEDKYDAYARLLAYVYLDGVMYNKQLVERGLAKVVKYAPNDRYYQKLLKVQEVAKQNKLGIWS